MRSFKSSKNKEKEGRTIIFWILFFEFNIFTFCFQPQSWIVQREGQLIKLRQFLLFFFRFEWFWQQFSKEAKTFKKIKEKLPNVSHLHQHDQKNNTAIKRILKYKVSNFKRWREPQKLTAWESKKIQSAGVLKYKT